MRKITAVLALSFSLSAWGADPELRTAADVRAYTQALPDWADQYGDFEKPSRENPAAVSFRIDKLMQDFSLDRTQAFELQNNLRDRLRGKAEFDLLAEFQAALSEVRGGKYERLDVARLKAAPFIVVFDLDETFYDQSSTPEGCADAEYQNGGRVKRLKFNPSAIPVIDGIRALGGEVVLFSANEDASTLKNLDHWKVGDKTMLTTDKIAGVLTTSYLTLRGKGDGNVITVQSKDLRIFDESLSKVIIVDDNPTKIFQNRNHRQIRKFKADLYCTTQEEAVRNSFRASLPRVLGEIAAAVWYMQKNPGTTFVQAYLPYSALGQIAIDFLKEGNGLMDDQKAVDYLRKHPEVVDQKF
jgi:hypothetical protein